MLSKNVVLRAFGCENAAEHEVCCAFEPSLADEFGELVLLGSARLDKQKSGDGYVGLQPRNVDGDRVAPGADVCVRHSGFDRALPRKDEGCRARRGDESVVLPPDGGGPVADQQPFARTERQCDRSDIMRVSSDEKRAFGSRCKCGAEGEGTSYADLSDELTPAVPERAFRRAVWIRTDGLNPDGTVSVDLERADAWHGAAPVSPAAVKDRRTGFTHPARVWGGRAAGRADI